MDTEDLKIKEKKKRKNKKMEMDMKEEEKEKRDEIPKEEKKKHSKSKRREKLKESSDTEMKKIKEKKKSDNEHGDDEEHQELIKRKKKKKDRRTSDKEQESNPVTRKRKSSSSDGNEDQIKHKKKKKEKRRKEQLDDKERGGMERSDEVDKTEKNTDAVVDDKEMPAIGQWSNANFESTTQKDKFIRLLGGFKKGNQESGLRKTSITSGAKKFSSVAMNTSEEANLNKKLELQYQQAFDTTRMKRGQGLGYDSSQDKDIKTFYIDKNSSNSTKMP